MKKLIVLILLVTITSCKDNKEKIINYSDENLNITTSIYPESVTKVFESHGGIDAWNTMQSLEFTMPSPDGDEITFTNLKTRTSLIKMPKHTIGFDGHEVWLQKLDTTAYKGNPRFYYNLMFYFYAMPFVLGDAGINYEEVEPLFFEGKQYPGIKISYESGIGESPDDEYIMYYDSETNLMTWLAYTVTYFTKEKAKEFHFIKYSNWQKVNGLLLPETLDWYNYENNLPTTKRDEVKFINIKLSIEKLDENIFIKPDDGEVVN